MRLSMCDPTHIFSSYVLCVCVNDEKTFAIRTAELLDLDVLLQLEAENWVEAMRHPAHILLAHISAQPPRIFVLEVSGQVVGSICTQRIDSIEDIDRVTWTTEDIIARTSGRVLHLLRVNTFRELAPTFEKGMAIGAILRDFCLLYARSCGFETVCAAARGAWLIRS